MTSLSLGFAYGTHLSQTYDLPDVLKSAETIMSFVLGGSVLPKKKKEKDDEDDR